MRKIYEIKVVNDGEWNVRFNGRSYGPFPDEDAAMTAAIAAGSKAASLGVDAEVSLNPVSSV